MNKFSVQRGSEEGEFPVSRGIISLLPETSDCLLWLAYIINPMNTEPALRSIYIHCPSEKANNKQ